MKKNFNNLNLTYKVSYNNAQTHKSMILSENKNLSGIYKWNNLITNKSYVGSAVNLSTRLASYFSPKYLNKVLLRNKSVISEGLLKYGYSNFSLNIIEYCEPNLLISKEQYYMDLIKPEYNICKRAGSWLGNKHSLDTLEKLRARRHSPETIANIKIAMKGKIPTSKVKMSQLLATGHLTKIVNVTDNTVNIYNSIRLAARDLNISHSTLLKYKKLNKLINNKYLVSN